MESNIDHLPDPDVAALQEMQAHLVSIRLALVPVLIRAEQRQRNREHMNRARANQRAKEDADRRPQQNGPALSREDRLSG